MVRYQSRFKKNGKEENRPSFYWRKFHIISLGGQRDLIYCPFSLRASPNFWAAFVFAICESVGNQIGRIRNKKKIKEFSHFFLRTEESIQMEGERRRTELMKRNKRIRYFLSPLKKLQTRNAVIHYFMRIGSDQISADKTMKCREPQK